MYAQSKRSAYPQPTKQQGTRSRNPARNGRKSKPILYRLRKICKRYNWARIGAALLIFGAAASTVWGVSHLLNRGSDTEAAAETRAAEAAVAAVFDFGHVATTEPIKYFYAPALTDSEWHESQAYVMTINNHKFFKEADHDAGSSGNETGGH